MNKKIQVF